MKIKDVHFKNEPKMQEFQRECLLNKWVGDEYTKHVRALIRKATDVENLIDLVLNDEYMRNTQAYAEISKRSRPKQHWYRVRNMFGDKQFKTISDAGGLKIGTDEFNTVVPNGRGDGETRCAVFQSDDKSFNADMMNYYTTFNGRFYNIYAYDCGDAVAMLVNGKCSVYYYDGFVAIKLENEIE